MPYVVGIDLGTTNCSVAYADAGPEADGQVHGLSIPQVVAPGEVAEVAGLPSFLLLAGAHEVAPESLALPWDASPNGAVGTLARDRGAELPHRLVASAKSWLCHAGVDREAPILPWKTVASESEAGDGEQVSPVEASARYLAHIRAAWNHAFPGDPLEDQEVLLTVPASFDAIARELTVAAARLAGLTNITLLEEPQAAFYAYLCQAGDDWREALSAGDVVLVCDIGGGTTDFSLIAVTDEGGNLGLERIAVGDHILLGGDNMDLALAHRLAQRLAEKGKSLSAMQTRALVHACRRAKEQLLSADAPESLPIAILGRGSKLIGGTIRTELSRLDVETLLIDGFFPEVAAEARPEGPGSSPTGGKRRATGLRTLGLPYASDPGITRHLAEFLARNSQRPTVILWNGGVMKGDRLRRRVADLLAAWHQRPKLPSLTGTDLDLAVSRGAAYYGLVRHGRGIRIRGGTARAYYIGVEAATPAIPGFAPPVVGLCVAPFGMEEGTAVDVPGEKLGLVVGETAVFRFFASTTRKED
ncbi:MAG TPA: Hsp70 family protein, partial [Kofleriaceae bacterium]|nr:Hsp70 family protein [Kofleriaceae bacterium]